MFQFTSPPMPHYIVCGEDTYPSGGKHPDRTNIGVFDLLIVNRGCLLLEEEQTAFPIAAGQYAVLHPQRSHRTAAPCREETHFYWLHFQTLGAWSLVDESMPPLPSQSDQPYAQIDYFSFYLPRTKPLIAPDFTYEQMRQLLRLQADPTALSQWKRQQLFHDLLLGLQDDGGSPKGSPHLVIAEQAAAFLRQHYKEPLDYKRLSEELHFHPNYIALCMKKTFGCTPLEYLTRHRVEQAKQMLIHTNDPIGKIADETGFGSFPYFVRCFSKHTGCKPKSFRLRYR